jgi:hypothetical protein
VRAAVRIEPWLWVLQAGGVVWLVCRVSWNFYTCIFVQCLIGKSMISQGFIGKTLPNLYRSGDFILQVLRYKLR